MNLTIYANEDEALSARQLMELIAKDKGWSILADPELRGGTDFKIKNGNRVATYDVESDSLIYEDDPYETEFALFGMDDWCLAPSLPEYLDEADGMTGVWGHGDDGQRYYLSIF